jgi:hypothetical protein
MGPVALLHLPNHAQVNNHSVLNGPFPECIRKHMNINKCHTRASTCLLLPGVTTST